MENQQQNPTPLEKLDLCGSLLDKLSDAQGRAKCGYIYIINEFLNDIKQHMLILEEQVKDLSRTIPPDPVVAEEEVVGVSELNQNSVENSETVSPE